MNKNQKLALTFALIASLAALWLGSSTMLGGGSRFPNGLSADSTSPSAGEVRGTTLTITGASTFSSTLSVTGETTLQGLTQGGGCNATSTTAASETLLEADLLASNCFEVSGEVDGMTLVLPATSTMTTLLPNAGDMREWMFEFATTSTATLTFSAGTGIDLIAVTANDDVIDEGEYARLTCLRQTDTDVACIISELLAAD